MQRFCSVFHQILKLVSRTEFQQLADRHGSDRRSKGFSSWSQFVAMIFCQLGRAQSLREIEQGLASAEGRLQQLGVDSAAKRTTLAYANAHRPWQLYQDVFQSLYVRCHDIAPGHKFRFKSPLLSLDASTIDLCAAMFDWARFRRTKGAVKLHLLLDHDGHLPRYAVITDGKTSDIDVARRLELPPGSIVVFDRGYNDYLWFTELTLFEVGFVTRMKENSLYEVIESRTPHGKGVVRDQIITIRTKHPEVDEHPVRFRRIEFVDADGKEYVFLTNRLDLAAATIAEIYHQRWKIELFFKAIKQNLRIKTFVGTSENALHIQIWTALIAMLMLRFLQLNSRWGWSLSNLVAMIRLNLFTYRNLFAWLDDPFTPPDVGPADLQLSLAV
ncbi:MAG: IS4 family transposase [Thermoanaerobaculia bacterium]